MGKGGGLLAKHSIVSNDGRGGGGLVVLDGMSLRESKNRYGEVGGVEIISSNRSKFMANGEDCLDGYDGAVVEKSKVVVLTWEWSIVCLGWVKGCLGQGSIWWEKVEFEVQNLGLMLMYCSAGSAGSMCSMERPLVTKGTGVYRPAENVLF
ncbi:hypothetical protein Tco_0713524 [Tanacetum coccineum]